MMGPKKLSEIKAEIRDAFAKKGMDVETWLDQQMAKLKRGPLPDSGIVKELAMIRDALERAVKQKKPRKKPSKSAKRKSAPVA